MAQDAQGRPIPVFVPDPPQPPDPTPPDHVSPHPDIENDVGLLKGAVKDLSVRLAAVERFAPEVGQLGSRVDALEALQAQLAEVKMRMSGMETTLESLTWRIKALEEEREE